MWDGWTLKSLPNLFSLAKSCGPGSLDPGNTGLICVRKKEEEPVFLFLRVGLTLVRILKSSDLSLTSSLPFLYSCLPSHPDLS